MVVLFPWKSDFCVPVSHTSIFLWGVLLANQIWAAKAGHDGEEMWLPNPLGKGWKITRCPHCFPISSNVYSKLLRVLLFDSPHGWASVEYNVTQVSTVAKMVLSLLLTHLYWAKPQLFWLDRDLANKRILRETVGCAIRGLNVMLFLSLCCRFHRTTELVCSFWFLWEVLCFACFVECLAFWGSFSVSSLPTIVSRFNIVCAEAFSQSQHIYGPKISYSI